MNMGESSMLAEARCGRSHRKTLLFCLNSHRDQDGIMRFSVTWYLSMHQSHSLASEWKTAHRRSIRQERVGKTAHTLANSTRGATGR